MYELNMYTPMLIVSALAIFLLGVYVLYSRLVRLPELPRSVDLFRAAIRGR